jgi:multiple antibiotic resistance protein
MVVKLEKFLKDFLLIWITIEPISSLALFITLTSGMPKIVRQKIAIKACVYSAIILLISIIAGQVLLSAMQIRLASFQLAGGIILALFGLEMIFGKTSVWISEKPETGHDIAVFPLAVPSIVGAESIVTIILLTDNDLYGFFTQALTGLAMLLVLLVTFILLLLGNVILKIIGKNGAAILERLMGILLVSYASELVMTVLGVAHWVNQNQ